MFVFLSKIIRGYSTMKKLRCIFSSSQFHLEQTGSNTLRCRNRFVVFHQNAANNFHIPFDGILVFIHLFHHLLHLLVLIGVIPSDVKKRKTSRWRIRREIHFASSEKIQTRNGCARYIPSIFPEVALWPPASDF